MLLLLIIAVQLVYTVGMFNSKKIFHTDEMWSYGLANSEGRPFLFLQPGIRLADKDRQQNYKFNEWIDGSYYKYYLVADKNRRFDYKSVIYNQTLDMHPPLYFSVLHTICSFFPERFSWYFGLSINLVSLCITQIFLFLLAYELTKRRTAALAACAVYAAGVSALFAFTFIRQYAMLTAWCTALTYFIVRLALSDFNFKRYLAPVIACLFLGGLTQQLILIYAGGLTFFVCLYAILKRKIKKMLIFGFSMAVTVLFYMGVWPYALGTASEYEISHIYSYWIEVRIFLRYILINTFGISSPLSVFTPRMPIFVLLGMIAAAVLLLGFVFRNDAWFKRLLRIIRVKARRLHGIMGARGALAVSIAGGCAVLILVTAYVSSIGIMGNYSLRYVVYIIPAFVAAVIYLFDLLCRFFVRNRNVSAVICAVAAVCVCVLPNIYGSDLIHSNEHEVVSHNEIRQMLSGKKVMLVLTGAAKLQSFPEYFMDADKVFVTKYETGVPETDCFEQVRNDDVFYVIVNAAHIIWEKDMKEFAQTVDCIPKDADKETIISLSVQFYDDYMRLFEKLDFVDSTEIVGNTINNGYQTAIFKIKTKK